MTRPPADLRCAYGAASDVQCSNKAKWRTNIDLPVVECCWCDEHKDDDDMPLYPERATPPAEMLKKLVKQLGLELYKLPTVGDAQAATVMDAADVLYHFVGLEPVDPSERVTAAIAAQPIAGDAWEAAIVAGMKAIGDQWKALPNEQTASALTSYQRNATGPGVTFATLVLHSLRRPAQPSGELMRQFTDAVQKLAFEMPAPNPYTPRLVQMCQAFAAIARPAQESEIALKCAKLICPLCAGNRPLNSDGNHVSKPDSGGILLPDGRCLAWPIHEVFKKE